MKKLALLAVSGILLFTGCASNGYDADPVDGSDDDCAGGRDDSDEHGGTMSDNDLEDREAEERFGRLLKSIEETPRLVLSDEEWMSIIARERDGLPACCANISALRDRLISIAREDGEIGWLHRTDLARVLTWCFPDHDVPSDTMQKILDQVNFEMPGEADHMKDRLEL